ncbi:hypothetical protein GSI_08662 [Ganoderma sinense ZZ0214-1]|uniref:Pyranose 2-oxidase n=1 Tax=Ganoderma sinense ZZ0214-1 TaxID=1077348 RepID=A0A2G8S4C1_9APHY|nr:hypothetical protein GSI_08662 [Ganoderma sinense ZZ0214-1]
MEEVIMSTSTSFEEKCEYINGVGHCTTIVGSRHGGPQLDTPTAAPASTTPLPSSTTSTPASTLSSPSHEPASSSSTPHLPSSTPASTGSTAAAPSNSPGTDSSPATAANGTTPYPPVTPSQGTTTSATSVSDSTTVIPNTSTSNTTTSAADSLAATASNPSASGSTFSVPFTPPSASSTHRLSPGAIAAIAISVGGALLVLILGLLWYTARRRRRAPTLVVSSTSLGSHTTANLSETTLTSPAQRTLLPVEHESENEKLECSPRNSFTGSDRSVDWVDPPIDFSKASTPEGRVELSPRVCDVMRIVGLMCIVNHGLTHAQTDRIFDIGDVMFTQVPEAERTHHASKLAEEGSKIVYKPHPGYTLDNGARDKHEQHFGTGLLDHRTVYCGQKHLRALEPFLPELRAFSEFNHYDVLHNIIRYQKDIDAFVNVIKGALQPVSVPPSDTYISTLGGDGWTPSLTDVLITEGRNPHQDPRVNLKATAVTRTVGGMATHWTCACPMPHAEERVNNPIPRSELDSLLEKAKGLLNVHSDQYNDSIRNQVVRAELQKRFPGRGITDLPLGVERRKDNKRYVTWTGADTVLKDTVKDPRFKLLTETRVTRLVLNDLGGDHAVCALVRDLRNDRDAIVVAKAYVVACGAVGTPQVLYNSGIRPLSLGRHLCEQSIAFCQIILNRSTVEYISAAPQFAEKVEKHKKKYPNDPLPLPFDDAEPQVMIPYSEDFPGHVQVHRDAFSYGDVGPKADPRLVVDLRFFGKQEVKEENSVSFGPAQAPLNWVPGVTDIYGMPQATFNVQRSRADLERDQRMMQDMVTVANSLGSFLPGSEPQFMEPGLALHITGTTRIGNDPKTSVADPSSKVHGLKNVWVGGNGCIPDSMACNPTRTSVAIAIKGAASVIEYLHSLN